MNDKDSAQLIADLPDDQRPREKALAFGMKALTDAELMAIVFGTGIKGKGVKKMCEEILIKHENHLSKIALMSARDFMKMHKGIGPAKALNLLAGIELGVRAASDAIALEEPAMTNSEVAFKYMHRHLYNLPHEEFWVLLLRNNLKPLREFKAGQGGLSMTAVDVKVIRREALLSNASALMLFHNHPSGTLKPSLEDLNLTKRIIEGAKLFDIRVLDHIIVGHSAFYSFHDEGKI